jgi:hypothetical protein
MIADPAELRLPLKFPGGFESLWSRPVASCLFEPRSGDGRTEAAEAPRE